LKSTTDKPKPVSPDEWSFKGVPDDELSYCFLYEYGREALKFIERVTTWRKQHPQIVKAAEKLLNRTGPFTFSVGPSPGQRTNMFMFAESGKAPTGAGRRQADLNGKAWNEWMSISSAEQPERIRGDDPRLFLYYFPPFPTVPWLKIQPERIRRIAFHLLLPGPAPAQYLDQLLMTAGQDFSAYIEWQRRLQAAGGHPMDTSALESMVRIDLAQHIDAPALREGTDSGRLPPGAQLDQANGKVTAAGVVHQNARFSINWAQPNKSIKKAFAAWLDKQGRRPHPETRKQNLTTTKEHLKKLSALRLLAHFSHSDAIEKADGLYSEESALRRVKGEAETLLRKIFPE
jgi:hypothetical protein